MASWVRRDDGEFPMDRTIHGPDRIRSKGQMEAALIRPIAPSEACGVVGAGSMYESTAWQLQSEGPPHSVIGNVRESSKTRKRGSNRHGF
jgi:hypothetical protein